MMSAALSGRPRPQTHTVAWKRPNTAQAASAASAAQAGQTASARSAFEYAGAPRRASCDHAKVVDLLASAIEELNAAGTARETREGPRGPTRPTGMAPQNATATGPTPSL